MISNGKEASLASSQASTRNNEGGWTDPSLFLSFLSFLSFPFLSLLIFLSLPFSAFLSP